MEEYLGDMLGNYFAIPCERMISNIKPKNELAAYGRTFDLLFLLAKLNVMRGFKT